jgi:serine/threonine protein kinase
VTKLLVTARRRAYAGAGGGGGGHDQGYRSKSSASRTYGNLVRGPSARQGYTSRYGGYLHQRPQSAQGGAYRLARARKQQQSSDAYQKALMHQQHNIQGHMRIVATGSGRPMSGSGGGGGGGGGGASNFQSNYWGGGGGGSSGQQNKDQIAHQHPLLNKSNKSGGKSKMSKSGGAGAGARAGGGQIHGSSGNKNNPERWNKWRDQQRSSGGGGATSASSGKSSSAGYGGYNGGYNKRHGSSSGASSSSSSSSSSSHATAGKSAIGSPTLSAGGSASRKTSSGVSGTLSQHSQQRSNPNAPIIKLSPRSAKAKETAARAKAKAASDAIVAEQNANAAAKAATRVAVVSKAVAEEAEIAATVLVSGSGGAGSGGAAVSGSGGGAGTAAANSQKPGAEGAGKAAAAAAAAAGGDKKAPNDFAKMREANRLLAERNLKLREELELLRHQQSTGPEQGKSGGATGGAATGAASSTSREKAGAAATGGGGGTVANAASSASSAAAKINAAASSQAGASAEGVAASGNTSSASAATTRKAKTQRPSSAGPKRGDSGGGHAMPSSSGGGGVDWWDKNYALKGHVAGGAPRQQRPQSAGRVKAKTAMSGSGGGKAAAYQNTLRPQRRPGSAGRTRDASNKGRPARPTTAPGRRPQDQAVAHGMSGHNMVDAASEEVRLRALMNDINWDGRGRSDMYHFGKVLGTGSFGVVRLVHHKLSGTKTAVKTYDKRKIKDSAQLKRVQQEIRLMARANHPNIVRLFETLESQHRVHLVMEYVAGGNLCQYVKLKKKLTEMEARSIFQQLSHASAYLHSINVSHRDIKLENILYGADKIAKLTDFGFSVYTKDHRLKVFCGTPSYMAPEIVMRREYYGFPVDVWSLGVLLYAMLCGCFPFTANSYPNLYKKIARGQFTMPKPLSQSVRDLLRRMLCVNPPKRATMNQVRRHQWTVAGEIYVPKKANESPLLVADNPSDDLQNNAVVSHMQALGFRRGSIVESVLGRKKNHITTAFYLLCDKIGMPKNQAGSSSLASSAPASANVNMVSGSGGGVGGAAAGMAGAAAAAKSAAHAAHSSSSRPSTAGSSRGNSGSARTSGFQRPSSASRSRR